MEEIRNQKGGSKMTDEFKIAPTIAFSTSNISTENLIRERLYEKIGVKKTLKMLKELTPEGLKNEVWKRREAEEQRNDGHPKTGEEIIEEVINEIVERHKDMLDNNLTGKKILIAPQIQNEVIPRLQGVDVGVGPMGSGKTLWLHTMNWEYLTQPGLTDIPWLTMVNVGSSSSGFISLLKSILPADKQHLAAYHRLRMEKEDSINPFDTPLGCRKPFPNHLSFLVNLFSLFCTPLDKEAPPDGVTDLARDAIEAAYDELSDEKNPKEYQEGIEPDIDSELLSRGMNDLLWSWWEVVDFLFQEGEFDLATKAQRHAVPLLSEVATVSKQDTVSSMYTKYKTENGAPLTDFFFRFCIEAIKAYPILKSPTKIVIDDVRILSLDLSEVVTHRGKAEEKKTS